MKMGWKPGQGVGPRITAKEKKRIQKIERGPKIYGCSLPQNTPKSDSEESSESEFDINLDELTFAPDDYKPFVVQPKQNNFGLGYEGMDRKPVLSSSRSTLSKLTVNGKTIRGQVSRSTYMCILYLFMVSADEILSWLGIWSQCF